MPHSDEELTTVEPMEPTALEALTRGEVDIQVATARRWPRDTVQCQKRAKSMALVDQATAESCWYTLPPPKGKEAEGPIEGPSVRLAEILATTWGNLRVEARVLEIGATHLVARGQAWDLENNVAVSVEVRRQIVTRKGQRYSPDMIQKAANAANSIAFRNALFKVIPRTYVNALLGEAQRYVAQLGMPLAQRRERMVARFAELGVSEADLLGHLKLEKLEQVEAGHLTGLVGLYNAIREGGASKEEVFGGEQVETSALPPRVVVMRASDETTEETAGRG